MKKIISLILILASVFSVIAVSASAAKTEEFLSDIALIYEDSVEDAKEAIAGTDWKLFEQDLNKNADYWINDGVYLIYKTSTNVEDAITDLRVMDMYGGYSTSDYEKQLEASRAAYVKTVNELRIAAAEFKTLYENGDGMALLAYRQMNYYKDMRTEGGTETNLRMGDFFLHMPDDDRVVQVLFEGNALVVSNLITLLAIGISGEDSSSLSARIAEMYAIKDTLTREDHHEDAATLSNAFFEIRAKLLRYDALSEQYDLEDEEISEDEFKFISECAALALLLEGISVGETNLADFIREGSLLTEDLYPIVAAFSKGQKALINMGQLETILKYNAPTKPVSELNALLDEAEKDLLKKDGIIQPYDVYVGVDRTVFKGAFAMTNAAERQQALTGKTWGISDAASREGGAAIGYIVASSLDVAILGAAAGVHIAYNLMYASAVKTASVIKLNAAYAFAWDWGHIPLLGYPAAVGIAIIILGTYGISTWYNYYNPDYLKIPNTLIDVKETDLGDKYVKYDAAKVYNDKDGRNADFNAYEGKEWVALYYTKDATAGNCLTPNFTFSENNATVARRHQGISMFGETKAFNLNSHVYDKNVKAAYVTVRYSNTKKAAADVPAVVGSMISDGAIYALCSVGGVAVGVGATLAVGSLRKKKKAAAAGEEIS